MKIEPFYTPIEVWTRACEEIDGQLASAVTLARGGGGKPRYPSLSKGCQIEPLAVYHALTMSTTALTVQIESIKQPLARHKKK